jgi:hypothetical protein
MLEAESYRTLPRADLLLDRGRAIAEKYIGPEAVRAVALSEPVRERILACCKSELFGPGLFIEAQVEVCQVHLMLRHHVKQCKRPAGSFLDEQC